MKNLLTFSLAALLAMCTTSAFAEPFNGLHIGAGIGTEKLSVEETLPGQKLEADKSKRSTDARLFAGYDFKITDHIVLGGEVGYKFKDHKVSEKIGTIDYKVTKGRTLDLTARAGFAPSENLLIYARGGVAKYDVKRTGTESGKNLISSKKSETRPVYGIGAEYAWNENLSLRGEYLRTKGKDRLKNDDLTVSLVYKF